MTSKNSSLIVTSNKLTAQQEADILSKGIVDLDDFMDNFQYLCFVLDGSGSTHCPLEGDNPQRMTVVDLEKKVIQRYADKKIGEKALSMKIGIVEFDNKTRIHLTGSSDLQEIKAAIGNIGSMGGGTTISKGIRGGLSMLKKSKDFTPRIILTSDGEFYDIHAALEAAEDAKKKGIVIDTIYCGAGRASDKNASELLKRISEATGGVHEEITGAHDFEEKFLKVAERKMLSATL
jgi:uncharacterized protein YegL